MRNIKISQKEIYVMIVIFLITFLVRVPFFDYPVIQDSAKYAELSESLHNNFKYESNGEPCEKYPPGNAFIASFVLFFTDDSGFAVRFVSIFFSSLIISLCYFFLRFLNLNRVVSLLLSASVFFNPWFFYFTTISGLSEGAGIFFLLLGLFFMFLYIEKKPKTSIIVLGALFLGLSVMIRIVFIVVVAVFCFYFLWLFMHKKQMKDSFLFVVISTIPFVCWFIRNLLVKTAAESYMDYISHSIISYPYTLIYFILIVFPVAFLGLIWYILKSFKLIFSGSNKYWKLILVSFVSTILVSALTWDLVNHIGMIQNPWSLTNIHIDLVLLVTNPFFATRYFVTFIPILTILIGCLFFRKSSVNIKKLLIFTIYVIFLLIFTSFYTGGHVQNSLSVILPIPSTFVQKADTGLQLVHYINNQEIPNPFINIQINNLLLEESTKNLFNRLCKNCTILENDSDKFKDGSFLIIDDSCKNINRVVGYRCTDFSCVFESVGREKASIFKCN